MDKNRVKNLGIGALFVIFLIYTAIRYFTPVGIGLAIAGSALVIVVAAFFKKDAPVFEKLDFYIFITFVFFLGIHWREIYEGQIYDSPFETMVSGLSFFKVAGFIASIVLYIILLKVASGRSAVAPVFFFRAVPMFLIGAGFSFLVLNPFKIWALIISAAVAFVYGVLAAVKDRPNSNYASFGRITLFFTLIQALSVLVMWLFPAFRLSDYSIPAFVSAELLPWPAVLIISLGLLSVVGAGLFFGKFESDADTVLLSGFVGLAWVIKASFFYHFLLSVLAVAIYALLFVCFLGSYLTRTEGEEGDPKNFKEAYVLLIAAVLLVISLLLIKNGYIFFWASLVIGVPAALLIHNGAPSSAREIVFRLAVLAVTAFSACMLAVQCGYNAAKIFIIVGMFVVAAAAMFALCIGGKDGSKWMRWTKLAVSAVFALLCLLAALKSDIRVNPVYYGSDCISGSIVLEDTKVRFEPDCGKNAELVSIEYVWADGLIYDRDLVKPLNPINATIPLRGHHLIVWVESSLGIRTRRDFWYYDRYGIEFQ